MCAVSAVTDYYRDKWFQPAPLPYIPPPVVIEPVPYNPNSFTLKPGVTITKEQWDEYQELKRRMEEYDAETEQPDCIKPEVAVWEKLAKSIVDTL